MFHDLKIWCLMAATGLSVGTGGLAMAADPPSRLRTADGLPPVISVEDAMAAHHGAPVASLVPAMNRTSYGLQPDAQCDCEDCEPHYLFHRWHCPPNGYGKGGCKAHLQYSHWGYCDQFCERPFGPAVAAHFQTQIANGLASQMMLFEYDFQELGADATDKLSLRGLYQLEKIAVRYQQGLGPVLIESTLGDNALDDARKASVERELKQMGVDIKSAQVVVRRPPVHSFNGYESLLIYRNREGLIMSRGSGGLSTGTGSQQGQAGSFPTTR